MKNVYHLILVALVLATQNLYSQHTISGIVKSQSNDEIIANATVYLVDYKTGVTTDSKGFYSFVNFKSGAYLIEASSLGYATAAIKIDIKNDTTLNFSLPTLHKELNEVVITGVSRSSLVKQNPVIIKTLDKNYLNQNLATNIIDALKNVPGVNQITTGAAISKPVIRGMGYNRVITLLDGIKQEGQQWGDEHGIEIDEYSIGKIEIIKGPGSLMYGSDGIAGVLNFSIQKAPNVNEIKTQITTNYQSNNNLLGYSIANSGNKKGIQWLALLSNKYASNFQNRFDGKVLNSGFNELNGTLFLGVNKNWGHSHLHISSFNTMLNLPEGDRDSTGRFIFENKAGDIVTATNNDLSGYATGFPHQVINHLRASSLNYFILKKGTVNVDIGFQNNKRKEYASIADPNETELFFDLNTINYNLRYNLNKMQGWETSIGASGMQQSHINRGVESLIPNYNLFDAGIFITTQKTWNQLSFSGGIRFDNRNINSKSMFLDSLDAVTTIEDSTTTRKFEVANKNYKSLAASLGIAYQASPSSTFKLNIARGFRAPNIAELASNGRHEGTNRYELGSSNLKAEVNHQLDIAYFLNTKHVVIECSPFVNYVSNYIYARKSNDSISNTIPMDPSDPAEVFEFAQGNVMLVGGEFYFDIHPHPFDWLHLSNSFSIVQATQADATDSTKFLPLIPAPKYNAEIKIDLKKINKYASSTFVKVGMDYFFPQNNVYSAFGTETATPAYTLVNAGIGSNFKLFNKNDFLTVIILAENIFDIGYQNHLSRLKYAPENPLSGRNGIFNQGRNISLKLKVNI